MIVRTHLAVYPRNSATSRGVLPSFACHKICQWVRSTASVVCRYRFWSSSAVKSVCTSTLFAIPPLYTTWTDFILEALRVHRIQQEQIRVNVGEKWQDKGLVFCDGYGGFFSPDMVLRRFDKLWMRLVCLTCVFMTCAIVQQQFCW